MADDGSPEREESFRDALNSAVRKAGIGQVAPGEVPTGASLLKAVGGIRGLIEAVLPGLGFLIVYAITREVLPSVVAPVALALVFVVIRLVSKTPLTQAFAGVFGVALSAGLALFTGRAEDNFALGLMINVASVVVLLVSIVVRWPLIGIIAGVLTNELTEWRQNKAKRRVLTVATWLWVGVFSLRLVVQVPLYFSGQTELLAAVKLLMGIPLYAAMLWITWLLVTSVYRRVGEPKSDDAGN
ncbi:hypothetical protein BKA04_000055 [Cryobacterium mesophilum]|uniref:DUF3159 domain-containing protein n=1 Tax=Terrimesophilobacter mesophilus TaxID=433647 RepID=UPI0017CA591D|nr:DUF3159 domain-containing protein [Terrimesophilobacter mesophilus]MBB5631832.1 hypothetical protein [Terrimesophilobacter mesophilus]